MKAFSPNYDKFIVSHIGRKDFLDTLNGFLNKNDMNVSQFENVFKKMFAGGVSSSSVSIARSLLQGNMIICKIDPKDKSRILDAFDNSVNLLFSGKPLKRERCRIL